MDLHNTRAILQKNIFLHCINTDLAKFIEWPLGLARVGFYPPLPEHDNSFHELLLETFLSIISSVWFFVFRVISYDLICQDCSRWSSTESIAIYHFCRQKYRDVVTNLWWSKLLKIIKLTLCKNCDSWSHFYQSLYLKHKKIALPI